jgi:hypothetical protein
MHEAAILLLASALGARLEIRTEPAPSELAPAAARRLAKASYAVSDPEVHLTLWLANAPARALAEPSPGTLVGALRVDSSWTDYRGGRVGRGTYTLRYAMQPILKEHAGVSPHREFLLLVPAASDDGEDGDPARWVAASRGVSSATHPAVLALFPATSSAGDRLETTATGELVLAPASSRTGLVVRGRAAPSGF